MHAVFDEIVGPRGREHSNLVGELIEGRHPESPPHFYLFAIGVDPWMQGRGAGSRLLRHVLDRRDREGVPAYPENSKERSLPFYEKHGVAHGDAVGVCRTSSGPATQGSEV